MTSRPPDPTTGPRRGRRVPFPPEWRRCPEIAKRGDRCKNYIWARGRCHAHFSQAAAQWWAERGPR